MQPDVSEGDVGGPHGIVCFKPLSVIRGRNTETTSSTIRPEGISLSHLPSDFQKGYCSLNNGRLKMVIINSQAINESIVQSRHHFILQFLSSIKQLIYIGEGSKRSPTGLNHTSD